MPLDNNFGDQLFNARCLGWSYEFAWRPHRCHISRRWLWLRYAYVGSAAHRKGDDLYFEHRWHEKHEHLIWALKR